MFNNVKLVVRIDVKELMDAIARFALTTGLRYV